MAENQTITVLKGTTLAAGANNGSKQQNKHARGVILVVDITANSGTSPTLTVKLQEFMPGGNAGAGRWVDVTGATTTALDATSVTNSTLVVYPGCIASANAVVNRPLGEHWRCVATVGGSSTPTVTASITAQLIL